MLPTTHDPAEAADGTITFRHGPLYMAPVSAYEQALAHYRNKCFYHASPDDIGTGTSHRPARWEHRAMRLARRYVRMTQAVQA